VADGTLDAFFLLLDKDKDGTVSLSEFTHASGAKV
jgi:Ca2+-binding EF-hand superfamily protein